MRESAFEKSRRLLTEGRVRLLAVDNNHLSAEVRGDSAKVYVVSHEPGEEWMCDCASYGRRCSHIQAVQLVTVVA